MNMKIKAVDTGLQHCIALSNSGNHVLVWGKAINGQLGITDHHQEYHSVPQIVRQLEGIVTEVSAGFNHSAALTAEGAVYVWGKGMSMILKENARKGNSKKLVVFMFFTYYFHTSNEQYFASIFHYNCKVSLQLAFQQRPHFNCYYTLNMPLPSCL